MQFRTIWIFSLAVVATGVLGSLIFWILIPWSTNFARYMGLVLAVLGIAAAIPYLKASQPDEYLRASLVFLLWLFLAIGFALRTML